VSTFPSASLAVALSWVVSPTSIVAVGGDTCTWSTGFGPVDPPLSQDARNNTAAPAETARTVERNQPIFTSRMPDRRSVTQVGHGSRLSS